METINLTQEQDAVYNKLMGAYLSLGLTDLKAEKQTLKEMAIKWPEIKGKKISLFVQPRSIKFTRVINDTNGNPRYVCHFLELISDKDEENHNLGKNKTDYNTAYKYVLALKRAKQLGGRKFHNKQFGGGIVFQSYNIKETERKILELINSL